MKAASGEALKAAAAAAEARERALAEQLPAFREDRDHLSITRALTVEVEA